MSPIKDKLPLSKALFYIALSIVVCSLLPALIVGQHTYYQKQKTKNTKYRIAKLVQTGPVKEALKSEHLEELLGLCTDSPVNLYSFDLEKGRKNLLDSGVIKQASLSVEEPNSLVVDYTVREPMAYISDYSNLVVDEQGALFPLLPYFTPKLLPQVYLGVEINPMAYGLVSDKKFEVAKEIFLYFEKLNIKRQTLLKVDVSNLRAQHLGGQEIIVTLSEKLGKKNYKRYLRLSCDNYLEEIEHYLNLKQMAVADDLVVDLRLLPNAYLSRVSELIGQ